MYPQDSDISSEPTEATKRRQVLAAKRFKGEFLRGPVPLWWIRRAACLPGKALALGLAIWFKRGATRRDEVAVNSNLLTKMDISRYAAYRALRGLEQSGLIRVKRSKGKCARVEVILDNAHVFI